ncbi:MAG: hypothetical protein LN412_06120, partial [Candidatus Thermoplasmatota archaeon]|nr:hypothetical protein [Candidatus Thermoplasmatota archaeon]
HGMMGAVAVAILVVEDNGRIMLLKLRPQTAELEVSQEMEEVPPDPGDTTKKYASGAKFVALKGNLIDSEHGA